MKYEAKVKYTRVNEISGKEQKVSESYIVNNAETFADAEEQAFKYMAERTPATVMAAIKISDIEDVIGKEADWYYKARIITSVIDEINGKEQDITVNLLVQAANINAAMWECDEWMSDAIVYCELISLGKTKIVDIIGA